MPPDSFDPRLSKYFTDPIISQYTKFFGFSTSDAGLLWIVDEAIAAPLPLAWEEGVSLKKNNRPYYWKPPSTKSTWVHPVDAFYLAFTRRLRDQLSGINSTDPTFYFTQRPPNVCIDVLNMCAFLDLDPASSYVWIALVALCTPLPPTWQQRDDYTYLNIETKEESTSHPCDLLFYTWVREAPNFPEQTGEWIFPKLSAQESAKIPEGKILSYSFKQCRACILDETVVTTIKRITPPSQFAEDQPDWIKGAIMNASSAVFGAEVYTTQALTGGSKVHYIDSLSHQLPVESMIPDNRDILRALQTADANSIAALRFSKSLALSACSDGDSLTNTLHHSNRHRRVDLSAGLLSPSNPMLLTPNAARAGIIDNVLTDEIMFNSVREVEARTESGAIGLPLPRPRETLVDRRNLYLLLKAKNISTVILFKEYNKLKNGASAHCVSTVSYVGLLLSNTGVSSKRSKQPGRDAERPSSTQSFSNNDAHNSSIACYPERPTQRIEDKYKITESSKLLETSYYSYQRAENKAKVEQTIKRNTVSHSQSQSQPVTGSSILYQSLVDPVGGLASSQTCNHSVVPSADLLVNASMSKQAIIANSGKLESTPNRALKMTTVLGTTPLYDISAEGTRARMGLLRVNTSDTHKNMSRARSPSPPSTPIVGTSRHINSFDNLGLLGSRYKSLGRNGRSPTKIASPCFNFSRLNATGRNGSPARSARRRARSNVEPRSSTGSCNIRGGELAASNLHPATSPTRGITPTPMSQREEDERARAYLLQHRDNTMTPQRREYVATDFVIALLALPPPTVSFFYGKIQVDSKTFKEQFKARTCPTMSRDPVNSILYQSLSKLSAEPKFVNLKLKVKVEYDIDEDTYNVYNKSATHEAFRNVHPWYVPIIQYYINNVVVDGSPTSECFGFVLNTTDFFISMPIIISEHYKFIISDVDGITKTWLSDTLEFLHQTCERIDSEIGKCHGKRSANVYNPVYTINDVKECKVSIRMLCDNVLTLFAKLQALKPSIKLSAFADSKKKYL
ncbi:Hypothetical protein DHA2_113662 [Giardia duodenalis]|uniref:WW domain-containing protein n=1 Tax=Giardia intestinalis TaxID=5741 RepID=V6TL09_GIAIN|nr:Hypothetical protein DHA2_113662 [Giardia intestinalis]